MTSLDEKTIQAIQKITEAIKETEFEINRFEVFDAGDTSKRIGIDIVEKKKVA